MPGLAMIIMPPGATDREDRKYAMRIIDWQEGPYMVAPARL